MPAAVAVVASSFYDVARCVRRRREISSLETIKTTKACRHAAGARRSLNGERAGSFP